MIRFAKNSSTRIIAPPLKPVYTFKKQVNRWYIDLPEYIMEGGSKDDLEMVEGADELLNLMAGGRNKVSVQMDVVYFEGADTLELVQICEAPKGGGYYRLVTFKNTPFNKEIWLCDVTLFVFGDLPEKIFIKSLNNNPA